jgi:type IX secretion system PorP/SprF family membrane protein
LTLNPAQTAFFDGQYRIGANYRNQWRSLPVPFNTTSVFADFGLLKGKFKSGDWLGVGIAFVHDKAGDGELKTTQLMASAAFHKSLGTEKVYLSLGVQGGIIHRNVDLSEFYYGNQWNDMAFDRNVSSGEEPGIFLEWNPDLNAGLMFSFIPSKSATVFIGGAVRHIIRPKDSFYDADNEWGIRPVANVGAQINAGKRISIEPAAVFMMQKKAMETVLGTLVGYSLSNDEKDKGTFYLGIHGRISDALIFPVGYKIKNARLLFSYDVNISSLKDASQSRGAFEFSLVYAGGRKPAGGGQMMPCPRL